MTLYIHDVNQYRQGSARPGLIVAVAKRVSSQDLEVILHHLILFSRDLEKAPFQVKQVVDETVEYCCVGFSHGEHVNHLPPSCTLCHLYSIIAATVPFLISLIAVSHKLFLSQPMIYTFCASSSLQSRCRGRGKEQGE